ncbi:MAG TPA: flagellar biosynthetic protein FliO [Candidatus Deferrimicrobiaceae bacterium]
MNRRPAIALTLLFVLLAALASGTDADARTDRKRTRAPAPNASGETIEKAAETPPPDDNVAEPRPVLTFDNAAAAGEAIRESDIPVAVAVGRPIAKPAAQSEGPSFAWPVVMVVIALGLVLAILLGISRLMKKRLDRFGAGETTPGRAIAVAETWQVAPRTRIVLIEVLGNRYLIGVTKSQVTLIDKLPAGKPEKGPLS